MPLTPYELRALADIERELGTEDPVLAAALRRGRPPSPVRRDVPFWAGQLGPARAVSEAQPDVDRVDDLGLPAVPHDRR